MKMISAGQLRFRVRFDKQVAASVDGGGALGAWTEQFYRWADIRPLRGGEDIQAQRLVGKQPALIIVRYDTSTLLIDSSWRAVEVLNDSPASPLHYYALKTIADMERTKQFITMMAVEGDPDS